MPAQAGRWGRFSEHQARQLQRQVQAKEERIVELEMENAVLHLRLAQCRGMTGEAGSAAAGLCPRCLEQDPPRRSTPPAAPQLHRGVQKLKQDIKALRASSLAAFRACWEHLQDGLSAVEAAVQGAQLCHQALLAWQSKVGQLERSLQEADARYQLEKQKRRVLHNRLVELKGNIRVHCRIRPLLPFDKEFGDPTSQDRLDWPQGGVVCPTLLGTVRGALAESYTLFTLFFFFLNQETVLVKCAQPAHPLINKTYNFERVYGPEESQQVVFGDVCPLLTSLIDGYNVCIMAYGQTGCGKSYTMLGPHSKEERIPPWGPHSDLGIMPRAAAELFRYLGQGRRLIVLCFVLSNMCFSLLSYSGGPGARGGWRASVAAPWPSSPSRALSCRPVHSAEDFVALAAGSLRLRAELATLVHARSSRSHLIITATLTRGPAAGGSPADQQAERPPLEGRPASGSRGGASCGRAPAGSPGAQQPKEQVHAKLQLVDLAGSECAGVSGVTGSALRETSFINRSLAALADVLGALSERRGHIPYRNSQLTHFLQDVLGGDAKLLVMLCVSPCRKHVAETLRCLGFGARARQVQRGQASGGSPAPRKPR
uniref:Kinesin-like protein n=1 Tax=Canis lupus familiaris TaxID=9615 RepID=A0A8C0PTV3_CANLF